MPKSARQINIRDTPPSGCITIIAFAVIFAFVGTLAGSVWLELYELPYGTPLVLLLCFANAIITGFLFGKYLSRLRARKVRRTHQLRYQRLTTVANNARSAARYPHRLVELQLFKRGHRLQKVAELVPKGSVYVVGAELPPAVVWPGRTEISFEPINLLTEDDRLNWLVYANYQMMGVDFDNPALIVHPDQERPPFVHLIDKTEYEEQMRQDEIDASPPKSKWHHRIKGAFGMLLMGMGLYGIWHVLLFIYRICTDANFRTDVSVVTLVVLALIGTPVLIGVGIGKMANAAKGESWWLIPGGLVRTRTKRFTTESTMDRYVRTECGLLLNFDALTVYLSDKSRKKTIGIGIKNPTAFIAGWLATTATPTDEQVRAHFNLGDGNPVQPKKQSD